MDPGLKDRGLVTIGKEVKLSLFVCYRGLRAPYNSKECTKANKGEDK
jgi:hypothetical protein